MSLLFIHLLFNPSLKTVSIPSHSGASRTLPSPTGFLEELSNLRTTAERRKQDQISGWKIRAGNLWNLQRSDEVYTFEIVETNLRLQSRHLSPTTRWKIESSSTIAGLHVERKFYSSQTPSTTSLHCFTINKLIILIRRCWWSFVWNDFINK